MIAPPCESLGMAVEKLLLPIDLARCPLEIFPLANRIAKLFEGEIALLHVLDRRLDTDHRKADEEERANAERYLRRIGRDCLSDTIEARFRVRIGIPQEEIIAEAASTGANLILLPVFAPSIWRRLAGSGYGETVRTLVGRAPCGVFVVDARTRFNCLRRWALEGPSDRCAA
jgi:nucleotide-binding universal stress UspA family protein